MNTSEELASRLHKFFEAAKKTPRPLQVKYPRSPPDKLPRNRQ